MSKSTRNTFSSLLPMAALAALLPVSVLAQVDTSDWKCEYCPFPDGYEAEVEAGAAAVSDDSARIGSGNGYDDEGAYANVNGEGLYASGAYRLSWMAEDLGLDSRRFEMQAGKPGAFGVSLGYRELPYRLFDTTRTVFAAAGNDALRLPSDWVSSANTQNMTGLAAALQDRPIGSDRQILDLGIDVEAIRSSAAQASSRRRCCRASSTTRRTPSTRACVTHGVL